MECGHADRRKDYGECKMKTNILIVGSGVAGLFCALHLPKEKNILVITKSDLESSDSYLAQGGICVQKDDKDYESYFEDTCSAGHYKNNKESVDIMIRSSRSVIEDLLSFGVEFETENGELIYTKEGAHSQPRILYHKDITGKEITSKLLTEAKKRENITLLEYTTMIDLICRDNLCFGIVAQKKDGELCLIEADTTVLATGGIGGLYENSTNYSHLTGDALALSLKHDITLEHLDYIQIHPTTLHTKKSGRCFLISESVRGEGAHLYNAKGERFVDELLPRDRLTKAILEQMEKDQTEHVWLSMKHMDETERNHHFPNIVARCLEEGYDVSKDWIPVVPSQHYFMGGIKVDRYSKTSMNSLYAVGETSCNGVHGANRLASNSLLESLVFAKRAAIRMAYERSQKTGKKEKRPEVCLENYTDIEACHKENETLVRKEIERAKQAHEQSNHDENECRSIAYAGAAGGHYQ